MTQQSTLRRVPRTGHPLLSDSGPGSSTVTATITNRGRRFLGAFGIPLAICALARTLDIVLFSVLSRFQQSSEVMEGALYTYRESSADPGFLAVAANWDGQWYQAIAAEGYPAALPLDADGEVAMNPWAFFPAFPFIVRLLMTTSGLSFSAAAVLISVIVSTIAFCWLYRMVAEHSGAWAAGALVLGINCYPAAPVFSTAYSEGLGLLAIVASLDLLRRRRYGWFCLAMVLLGLTRPLAIAFAPVVVLHALLRWRREGPLSPGTWRKMSLAALSSVMAFVLWPMIAAAVTGQVDAYALTQRAWMAPSAEGWRSWLVASWTEGPALAVAVGTAVAFAAYVVLRPDAEHWQVELRTWAACYGSFLLVSARPTPSIIRYAMLGLIFCWPFVELGLRANRSLRIAVVTFAAIGGVLLHYAWIRGWWIYQPGSGIGYP